MPRNIYLACSGISLLLSTAVMGQVPHLPRHPTQQQIIGYHLQQQREWNLRQLPTNSMWYRAAPKFNTSLAYTVGWKAGEVPAYNTAYGFTLKQAPVGLFSLTDADYDYRNAPILKIYLQKTVPRMFNTSVGYQKETLGGAVLREILFPSHKVYK